MGPVLLCGIPSESPLEMVGDRLAGLGVPVVVFNQRRFAETEVAFEVAGGGVTGVLRTRSGAFPLRDFTGVYIRLMDDALLPEVAGQPDGSPLRERSRAVTGAISRWAEVHPRRVVNRARAMGSNTSKPYQLQIVRRHGFAVPETLVSNDPDLVRAFLAEHGRVIYKSVSGVRSVVVALGEEDLGRLDRIRWCPVQFQAHVPGTDVRVHTVGGEVFATEVRSGAIDYRYADRQTGRSAELRPHDLPDEVAERCVRLAKALGLDFAGIDLRLAPGGEVYCFEVNPSPAYSYYEANTGQPISLALARYLSEL